MSDLAPASASPTPSDPAPSAMHQNASKCTLSADSNSHLNTPAPRALTPRHLLAIDLTLAGDDDHAICFRLKIDRSTLYRWRHHNPLFIAESNRRHQEFWSDFSAGLRLSVSKAVRALDGQVESTDAVTQHRAARTLINLVNSPRIAPADLPTRVDDVLDNFLRSAQPRPTSPPPKDAPAPTFTDAQRQTLLDQILAEEAAAESALQAAAAQRSALYHQRRQQRTQESPTMNNGQSTMDNGQPTPDTPPNPEPRTPNPEP